MSPQRPLIGHRHPGPAWPPLPGEPLGIPRPIHMSMMSDAVGAAIAQCGECTARLGEALLDQPDQITALAATVYCALPDPGDGTPPPVADIRRITRQAAEMPERDFTPVMLAVSRFTRQGRALLLADLLETCAAMAHRLPPSAPPPITL
jgi:hypothetical protein